MNLKVSNFFLYLIISFSFYSQIIPNHRDYQWESFGLQDTSTSNFNNIDLSNYGFNSFGVIPNDNLLSSIINTFSSGSAAGVILNFPSGSYLFNQTISLPGNIVLKGKGTDSTILKFNLNGSGHAIEVIGSISNDTSNLSQNAFKDSNALFVSNPSMFIPGDWVRIIRNDSSLISSSWALNTVGQIVKINQITNNKLIINSNLRMNYNLSDQPFIKKIQLKENVGVECFRHRVR
jgi:hypothetical protein